MLSTKLFLLGTAQWGWTIDKSTAFSLLDYWLEAGERGIDCATNYPINRNPGDFRAAEKTLAEYIRAHGLRDLQITMKIGSLDNMRTPDVNLSPSFIQMMGEEYLRLFGSNLSTLMIHWDNRDDRREIQASLEAFGHLSRAHALRPGLSGIRHPELYAGFDFSFDIQLKHNVLHSDLPRYLPHFNPAQHRYFAYGINAGGLKLRGEPYPAGSTYKARSGGQEVSEETLARLDTLVQARNAQGGQQVTAMWQLGLLTALEEEALAGVVIGVSGVKQCGEVLGWVR